MSPTKKSNYDQERLSLIFECSPIAIWEEDFSAIAKLKDVIEKKKIKNIRLFLVQNTDLVKKTFRALKVLDVNQQAIRLYGAKNKKELIANLGRKFHKQMIPVLVDEFTALLEGKQFFEAEFKSRTLAGKLYDVKMRVSVPDIYNKNFKRVIVTLQDISVQKKYERHLKRLAQIDGLTGVLNHNAIRFRLKEEFQRAKRYKLDLSCMMIDLDDFKLINDKFGHEKGSHVLKQTAKIIKKNLREIDVVGRYGGDEFFIILPETKKEPSLIVAERLRNIFMELKNKSKKSAYCTLSIGVGGINSKDAGNVGDMIKAVDRAMYQVKKNFGKNNIVLGV